MSHRNNPLIPPPPPHPPKINYSSIKHVKKLTKDITQIRRNHPSTPPPPPRPPNPRPTLAACFARQGPVLPRRHRQNPSPNCRNLENKCKNSVKSKILTNRPYF